MEKVYQDSLSLGYSPSKKFDIPEDFSPCEGFGMQSEVIENYDIEMF